MDSTDSLELLLRTLRHWKLILVCALVGVGLAAVLVIASTKKYTSETQLFVATQGSAATADALAAAYSGSQFSTARVQSYIDLVDSPEIVQPIIKQLRLKLTPSEFSSKVSVDAPANTVLMDIKVVDASPRRAQRIAAAVARQYIVVIQKLETSPGQASPVRVSVSSPADYPTLPSSPKKKKDLVLGLLLGLIVGVGLAQLRDRLDNTIESDEKLQHEFGLQVLSHVPYDNRVHETVKGLSGSGGPNFRVEALRGLRTALRYIDVDEPPRAILVTSCNPGDGKTTTSAGLALVMAAQGQNVVIVEADLRRPKLRRHLDFPNPTGGISEVLGDGKDAADLVVPVTRGDLDATAGKLDLLGAGAPVPNPTELLGSQRMQALVSALKQEYDLVIIDASPVLPVTDAVVLSTIADGVLLVVEPNRTTRKQLTRATGLLRQVDARLLGAVLNKTTSKDKYGYQYEYGYGYAPEQRQDGVNAGTAE
jgi:capsular exopolysaccharide synthesis family protein